MQIQKIELMDAQGRISSIAHYHNGDMLIDLSSYSSGLYYIIITAQEGRLIRKVFRS